MTTRPPHHAAILAEVALVAAALGSTAAFLVGRYLARRRVANKLAENLSRRGTKHRGGEILHLADMPGDSPISGAAVANYLGA